MNGNIRVLVFDFSVSLETDFTAQNCITGWNVKSKCRDPGLLVLYQAMRLN